MDVDRDRFLEEGYLILRQVIPPAELEGLRQSCESLLERQREVWAQEREDGDPPGGEWEKSAQPRLMRGCRPTLSWRRRRTKIGRRAIIFTTCQRTWTLRRLWMGGMGRWRPDWLKTWFKVTPYFNC